MQLKEKEIKFETLKKSHKKQIVIGLVAICLVGGALTFNTTRAKYRLTQSIKIVEGEINYKPYDFKIMAMYQQKDGSTCTEDNCYNEITDRMPSSGYVINETKSYCTLDNKNKDTEAILKTIDGNHVISNLKKTDKCYIWFDKIPPVPASTIIANIQSTAKTSPATFTGESTTDEGVYAVSDGMYGNTSYYWRGAATTNHVIFANKCWRIIRINGDKTIRLIYNGIPSGTAQNQTCPGNGSNSGSIAVSSSYNASNQSNYVGWTYTTGSQRTLSGTASNAKTQTESWYNNNSNFTDAQRAQVADGKFCNDRNTTTGSWASQPSSTFYYAAYGRLENSKTPTLSCSNSGDVYTLKVGAITADEVMFAGGWRSANNTSYYLYNGQNYWTMSPCSWNGYNSFAVVFIVNLDGALGVGSTSDTSVGYISIGLRPVINLRADTTFQAGGLGTSSKPYVVN